MLPRLNTKVHPQRSLLAVATPPSSFEDKFESYECLSSPSAPPDDSASRQKFRWFYNYPRLSFIFLFVVCTYIGGIYVSSKVTAWTLDVLGVHQELTDAREMYLETSRMLNTMTQCVDRSSLEYLAGAKLQFEADHKRVQGNIDANDKVIADQRNASTTCSKAFLTTLKEQVTTTADSGNSTLSCFSDNFYANVPETDAASSSRALVLAVRALLTTQAVLTANDSVSQQQTQFENQLLEIWNSVDTVKTSVEKSLGVANALASKELSSLAPILSDSDGNGHKQQSASRLGRLGKVASSELSDPLALTSSASLEAIQKAGRTLHSALEFLSGLHEGFTDVMDTVDKTWGLLEKQLNATTQQAAVLQKELLYAANATAQQINHTTDAIMTSLNQTQQEISTLFDILQEQWQSAVKKLVTGGFKPWQRLGDQLVAELTANHRQSESPENSIQRKSILPDQKSNSSLENAREQLAYNEIVQNATVTSASTDKSDKFDIDTAVLRASLVDVGTFITQVVFYVDIGRLTLLAADLAVGLITESYSDMPMMDIRDITTVDTVGSVCEVFLCQHSFSAVCYTLVARASELLRVLVTFLLISSGAFIVTGGLFMWKHDHIAHCASSEALTPPTTIQRITRAFFENNGNNSKSIVDPIDEIEKYAITINESIRNDYTALSLASVAVWKNQSTLLDDSSNCWITTSNLVRMLQDCTDQISVDHVEDVSRSSQCLTSTFNNTSDIVSPSTKAEKLSADAPYLSGSSAFTSCFPDENLQMKREEIVGKLQHRLACATEKAVYLSVASWWLLIVIFVANRFTVRMIIKAAGVYWWRFLSGNRLQFTGFCEEDGNIVASGKLSTAIQQHLREAKWQLISRFIGIGFAFASVFTVIVVIFHGVA